MEDYLWRAMEVARLTPDELEKVQTTELRIARILMPFEIESGLKLPSLKDQYGIPEDENAQIRHKTRIRGELQILKLSPRYDLPVNNLNEVHEFDMRIKNAANLGSISFYCQSSKKARISDNLDN